MERGLCSFGTRISDEQKLRDSGVHHDKDLFDQNDDRRDVDEASGKPWDDTGGIGADESLREIADNEIVAPDECVGDSADQWLNRNDPRRRK